MVNLYLVIVRSDQKVNTSVINSILDLVNELFISWFNGSYHNGLFFGVISDFYGLKDVALAFYSLIASFIKNIRIYVFDYNDLLLYIFNGVKGRSVSFSTILSKSAYVGYIIACNKGFPRASKIRLNEQIMDNVCRSYGIKEYVSTSSIREKCIMDKLSGSIKYGKYVVNILFKCDSVNDLLQLLRQIILMGIFSDKLFIQECVIKPLWRIHENKQ
ncbi:hypothetical protein [Staphylothermus hellenicus]|uniref:Uncharacterized protein n=1 Tax=Staphylothermus hellenicus (strain DSM 12710 / JCM 10830 / BK20S6-10-b1 / P8) TaxID=591019 RepID=D7DBU4_STAHD|nr:hypothetical protein [Staphylothermus hellenicus]ADI31641.1 hypothetical protein Shell_0510 [Staphylothermus hellenicus DSM 12710]